MNKVNAEEGRRIQIPEGQVENFWSTLLFRVALVLAVVLYLLSVIRYTSRHFWHDELYTYYIATMPSMGQFWDAIKLDLNPPLNYLIARWCINLFGKNEFATRLPSMLGFLLGSICLYRFTSFRLPRVFGLLAVLVLWTSPYLTFASEARPYALVIGFLGLAMVIWQRSLGSRASLLGSVALCLTLRCVDDSEPCDLRYPVRREVVSG